MGGPLAGQLAVVTGGSRGIGAAIAALLAANGADLALIARNRESLNEAAERLRLQYGAAVQVEAADVSDAGATADVFKKLGEVSILVNNAGMAESAPFLETDPLLWERTVAVNLNSAYLCTREALPGMLKRGAGRIVNIASTAALRGYPYVSAYCAAKHGLVGLTRSLAVEFGRSGIRINAICPGFTETDLLLESIRKVAARTGKSEAEVREQFRRDSPGGRFVQPNEVAEKVLWYCLPQQEGINGEIFEISG